MIAASGSLSLFFLFLFCIIGHMLADFEKERNFFVVTSLQYPLIYIYNFN